MNVNRKRSSPEQVVESPEKKPRLSLFLEDYTPIRTIEVANVPTDLGEEGCKIFLRGYFQRDGPLEQIKIAKKTENEWLGYVTFVLPDDAAQLIYNKDTAGYARCSQFPIKMADDAHQIKIDPHDMNLEKVNDHCLLYIMSHLKLIDAVNLCKTSIRLQSVGRMFYRKYSKFSFGMITRDSSINETNLPVILEEIGKHVCSIDWHQLTGAQFELLVKYCPNVTEIKLTAPKRDVNKSLKQNKNFFAELKRLHIESGSHIFDGGLKDMMSGRKLKTLELHRCKQIRGKFIQKLNHSKLKIIKVVDCASMRDPQCFPLSEWKNKLTTFAYDACCSHAPCFLLPPESLEQLKELYLDFTCFKGDTQGFNFSALKKLTKITLTRNKFQQTPIDANNMINGLIQIDSLESLSIQGITVDNITIHGLRSINKLRFLKLDQAVNKIGRDVYELFREHLPMLQELSMYFAQIFPIDSRKSIWDMIAGMPKLNYFSHSFITWELLDGIRQCKSATVFGKKHPLKIGVQANIFQDPKKESYEAAHKGAITLSIHE